MKRIDLTGQKFNMLNVIELSEKLDASKCRQWKCRCDCGRITYASSHQLKSGSKKSCGCANPYASQKSPETGYPTKTDCIFYSKRYKTGCKILIEKLCVTKGKCGFYKSKGEV